MSWMPCTLWTCPENHGGQCFGGGCEDGGYVYAGREGDEDNEDENEGSKEDDHEAN